MSDRLGAPVGWRLAVAHPERTAAIVSQNGNGYEQGLSEGWREIRQAWEAPTAENREALKKLYTLESIKWQYTAGVDDARRLAPEAYMLAHALIEANGHDPQLDLILDY
jgi:pimeloyl-ACP methyl ester carboxylesterase